MNVFFFLNILLLSLNPLVFALETQLQLCESIHHPKTNLATCSASNTIFSSQLFHIHARPTIIFALTRFYLPATMRFPWSNFRPRSTCGDAHQAPQNCIASYQRGYHHRQHSVPSPTAYTQHGIQPSEPMHSIPPG